MTPRVQIRALPGAERSPSAGATVMRVRTLGDAVIEVGGSRLGPTSAHTFAAALYLSVERDRRVPRATLQGLFYPKSSEANASHNLRQLLYALRIVFQWNVESLQFV